ncbi:MAG: sigma-70 family RNA polymerase sigma factor, partial [Pirellulaceae bacterium]|nr:sigma-70 family RNA polymerase sigma factor [Pirellulaceae bacterium]
MSTLKTDIGTREKANLMKPLTNAYQDAAKKQKRDRLIEDHMEYVRQVCCTLCKRLPGTVDLQNLQSAGMVGLIQAAQKFDESKGINFKTYSYPRIRGAIIDEIRRNSPLTQKAMHLVGKVRTALETLEPPATTEAIAAAAKITLQEVDECLLAMQIATPQNCDEAGSVADREITPDTALEQQE